MDGAGGQHAGRGAETVQRAAPCAREHFAADADLDAEMSGARRPGDAHGLPDHSAARRLRADEARTFVARAGEQPRPMGAAKPLGHSRCTAAFRCGAEPPRQLTSNPTSRLTEPAGLLLTPAAAAICGSPCPWWSSASRR